MNIREFTYNCKANIDKNKSRNSRNIKRYSETCTFAKSLKRLDTSFIAQKKLRSIYFIGAESIFQYGESNIRFEERSYFNNRNNFTADFKKKQNSTTDGEASKEIRNSKYIGADMNRISHKEEKPGIHFYKAITIEDI